MARRVPVLGQDHRVEFGHQGVDIGHDLVALGHGKRAAGAEIVLDVDDDEGAGHGGLRVAWVGAKVAAWRRGSIAATLCGRGGTWR